MHQEQGRETSQRREDASMSTPQPLTPELDALAKSLVAMKLAGSNNASNIAKVLRLHLRKRNTESSSRHCVLRIQLPQEGEGRWVR